MKYLLDTNVLRQIGRDDPHPNVARWLGRVSDSDLAVSAVSVREIVRGVELLRVRDPGAAAAIDRWREQLFASFGDRVLALDGKVAEIWGRLLAESDRHRDDTAVAATALHHGLTIVTRNVRDFRGRGVALLDPYRSPPAES